MNQAHASNSSKTRSKLALRGCTTDPHYHLLCAATGGRFDKGSYDKENEIFVWDSNGMHEGLFSPFYLSNDGRWRSRFNPNIPSLADAAVPMTMEFDLSDLNENRVSLAWTDLNGVSAFDAMSKILKEAQTMVDAAVQGVPSQGLRQTVSDSSTLLQLIDTGRCRPSGAVASS